MMATATFIWCLARHIKEYFIGKMSMQVILYNNSLISPISFTILLGEYGKFAIMRTF